MKKNSIQRILTVFALLLATAGVAQANAVVPASFAVGNFTFVTPVAVIPGMISPAFPNPAGARFYVHFTAECAVNAPAGNTTAWTDVDIQVLNAAGVVVSVLQPTLGNQGAFCSANGSPGADGWQSNSVIGVSGVLPAGIYRVRVIARLNNGATQGWYGERTLLVTR
jgi:hypothetical protein